MTRNGKNIIGEHAVSKKYDQAFKRMVLRSGKTQAAEDRLVVQAYETSMGAKDLL